MPTNNPRPWPLSRAMEDLLRKQFNMPPIERKSLDEKWREEQRRLLAIEQKLEAAGILLDDLIDLIEARRNGRY